MYEIVRTLKFYMFFSIRTTQTIKDQSSHVILWKVRFGVIYQK